MARNHVFRSVLLAAGVALMAACASTPPEGPAAAPAASSAPAAAPAAAPAPAAAATPEAAAETEAATLAEKKFQELAKSYKMVQKDGKTMYCKREKVIGTTIPTMQCYSESQLRMEVQRMDDMRDRMRNSSRCTTGAGCGAGG